MFVKALSGSVLEVGILILKAQKSLMIPFIETLEFISSLIDSILRMNVMNSVRSEFNIRNNLSLSGGLSLICFCIFWEGFIYGERFIVGVH